MSIKDWFSGRRAPAPGRGDAEPSIAGEEAGRAIDPETGEVHEERAGQAEPTVRRAPRGDAGTSTVQGERAIPSVNRERSIQSRISNGLALGAMLVLGVGFLGWYYSTQFSKAREAEEAAKKATSARAAGEMKVPPLGQVNPPTARNAAGGTPVAASDILGPAPTPPQAGQGVGLPPAGQQAGPPPKTPAQLALERKLGTPVLLRAQLAQATAQAQPGLQPVGMPAQPRAPASPFDALLGGLQGRGGAAEGQGSANSLGELLKPTLTPAVAAQVVPTRRFLLPKGAFIDCTLETAIDSTYPGMTTCIGAHDVYSADGKVVLLERGTKYVGEQKGDVKLGQSRVFVLWNEARTPTGVVVNLASPGTDELGRSGLPGYVDTHFWDRFGAAILISVIDGALQALAASQQNGSGGTAVVLNPQGTKDIMTEVLKSTVAIPPTVIKNQGDRIQVLVARDVDFRPVYALRADGNTQ
jgi:type IV secretion system protein VirB10